MARLFMDYQGGATEQTVFRYVDATPTQVGNSFDTIESALVYHSGRNRVQQVLGELYALGKSGVWKKDDPTTLVIGTDEDWTSQHSFTNADATGPRRSGLHVIYVDDVPYLTGVFGDAGGDTLWRGFRLNLNTGVWDETAALGGPDGDAFVEEIVYRGRLHFCVHKNSDNSMRTGTWDPKQRKFSTTTNDFGDWTPAWVIDQTGRLLASYYSTGSIIMTVGEFSGNAWTKISSFGPANVGVSTHNRRRTIFFRDGSSIIAIHFVIVAGTFGWKAFKFDSSLVVADISATVLPSALRPVGSGGTWSGISGNDRMFVSTNNDTPGSPSFTIYHEADPFEGTTFTVYSWNGIASLMTSLGTGGDVYHSIPSDQSFSGGSRIWTAGELDALITDRDNVDGGDIIKFKASGGGTGKIAKIFFSTTGGHTLTQATLVTSSVTGGSAIQSGNDITNVSANGTTEYSATINYTSNSISDGDRVQYYIEIT